MIKSIRVKHYQSHRDSKLDFCDGMNAILGDPNSGKTSVLRAFTWLRENRPLGFRYHPWHAPAKSATEVGVSFTTGEAVRRVKTAKDSTYQVHHADGTREEYRKHGESVPDAVTKIINMGETNVQPQLDQFYLITSSPHEIGRALNRITRIEKVDQEYLPKLVRRLNKVRERKEVLEGDIKELEERQGECEEVEPLRRMVSRLIDYLDRQGALEGDIKELEAVLEEYEADADELEELRALPEAEPMIREAIAELERAAKLGGEVSDLTELLEDSVRIKDAVTRARHELDRRREALRSAVADMETCPVCLSKLDREGVNRVVRSVG